MPVWNALALPFAVAFRDVSVDHDTADELSPLLPGEEERVSRAVEKRRREYRAGRHVARLALTDLGLPLQSLPADQDGVPRFPSGIAASLSHTGRERTYAAAVATREVALIGLDVEECRALTEDIAQRIAVPDEGVVLARSVGEELWSVVCFSCKEAVYKCVFPRVRRMFSFHDVLLRPSGDGELSALVRLTGEELTVPVRFAVSAELVLSVAYLHH